MNSVCHATYNLCAIVGRVDMHAKRPCSGRHVDDLDDGFGHIEDVSIRTAVVSKPFMISCANVAVGPASMSEMVCSRREMHQGR